MRRTLTARAVLVTCLVALVAVLVTALVAAPLVVRQLRSHNIEVYVVRNDRLATAGKLPARLVTALSNGQEIRDQNAVIDGRLAMVEGRPLPNGGGVLLAEPAVTGRGNLGLLRGLGGALLAGLAAGAVAGVLLARRLARPIRHAAGAAVRLSSGDRSVRVTPEPPAEVEELAHALNGLAAALAMSEGRQRDFLLSVSHELRT